MVDKLIRGRIVEILVVVSLVLASIPVWNHFDEHMKEADILTLEDYNWSLNS